MKWLGLLVPIFLMYFIGAFVQWDFNPAAWGWDARLTSAFFACVIEILLIVAIANTNE